MFKVKNKEIILQIFSGGFTENKVTFESIEQKLSSIISNIQVDKVIMGWSTDNDIYMKTKKLLEQNNVEFYLWIPVFSEIGLLKESTLSRDFNGEEIQGYALQEGENFQFYCPSNENNVKNFIEVYEENFSHIGFDGIFLDKIRYGSFSNGLNGVFTCFCPKCLAVYKKKGFDVEDLKREINKVKLGTQGYNEIPFNIVNYDKGIYKFSNDIWKEYFDIKGETVCISLLTLKEYFNDRNMKIGIDVFSPFMAYFVGQNLCKLQHIANFIKPMMYRITHAPAGLPFECDNLVRESVRGDFNEAKERYLNIIGSKQYHDKFDIEFVKSELESMIASLKSDIYVGIEVNRKKPIANVYPEYIRENLENLNNTNVKGYVLSWDILSAPNENIQEVSNYFYK